VSNIKQPLEEENRTKEKMAMFLDQLDINNKRIFWYFGWYRHARITELTRLVGNSNDMDILYRLKEVINPLAVKVFGNPIIEFNNSKIDDVTGEKILFNWWLLNSTEDYRELHVEGSKPLIDIFDEEDRIVIISDIAPSIKVKGTAKVEQRNGIISITLEKI
jgi:hypothetical protein